MTHCSLRSCICNCTKIHAREHELFGKKYANGGAEMRSLGSTARAGTVALGPVHCRSFWCIPNSAYMNSVF